VTGLDVVESNDTRFEAHRGGRCPALNAAAELASTAAPDGEASPAPPVAAETDAADAHVATGTGNAVDHRGRAPYQKRVRWLRVLTRGVLPGAALVLAVIAGLLDWVAGTARQADLARVASLQAARESTSALLSYKHDTVDNDVAGAGERLTGNFKDAYNSLTHDVVIPGAKQKQISVTATVPAAASVSASESHAVVLVFVDQTVTMGNDAPTNTASSVRVTLDKINGRWLISQFDPI
jgi:Mce-associated membrane protein